MTTLYRKKLIEVALPLEAINKACTEDKNRKTGHIRNLHKWFAPMPLPAWRAAIFASIVDDPGASLSEEAAAKERRRLFGLIENIIPLDLPADSQSLADARRELEMSGSPTPVVVDPFCGGGSTIVEAQRLGLKSFASDLNPLPIVITTALCRIPQIVRGRSAVHQHNRGQGPLPNSGQYGLDGFMSDVRHYAGVIRSRAWSQFPLSADGHTIYAYRWARTVVSPHPAAKSGHTPLVTDWTMSKSGGVLLCAQPSLVNGQLVYAMDSMDVAPSPTVRDKNGFCAYTKNPIEISYVREQGREGKLGLTLFGIAGTRRGRREMLAPDPQQTAAAMVGIPVPQSLLPMPEKALGFRVQQYGISDWAQLFTPRQHLVLKTFSELVRAMLPEIEHDSAEAGWKADTRGLIDGGDGARAYAEAVVTLLGICVGRLAQSNNMLVRWFVDPRSGGGKATPAFDRHVVPMVWDFVETNPFGGSVGDWTGPVLETALKAFDLVSVDGVPADVRQRDARLVAEEIPENSLIATDPPYYANVGYAALSDFFYPWIRASLRDVFVGPMRTAAAPKEGELIADAARHHDIQEEADAYFRKGFAVAWPEVESLAQSLSSAEVGTNPVLIDIGAPTAPARKGAARKGRKKS